MTALYHVSIRWIKTEAVEAKIEPVFGQVGNWARLSIYDWYVWTNLNGAQIYDILRPHFNIEDSIAIFSVNPESQAGWAPSWFWKWINTQGASTG
jgi:hypothetical protein